MDGGQASRSDDQPDSHENSVRNKPASPTSANSRHSPVTPLAPLEFLQNQRRGSITDPSLHAVGGSGGHNHSPGSTSKPPPSSFRQQQADPSATLAKLQSSPPYRFGEVTSAQPLESSTHLRRLLRSPSQEVVGRNTSVDSEKGKEGVAGQESNGTRDHERMDVDAQHPHEHAPHKMADYESRRPSLAGTKRKMSPDAGTGPTDIDPQLIGPGVPSAMGGEAEGPAPKRRSSAFDTQRLAQLNLYDRRGSLDSRGGTPGGGGGVQGQLWGSERRETATPVFANTPVTTSGYTTTPSSAFSGDSPHGRPPPGIATFAWPTANLADPPHAQQQQQQQQQHQPLQGQAADTQPMAQNNPSYDPNLAMPPPGAFPQDRRMSVPTIAPENMPASPSSSPARALRSRSRPASRARANQSASNSTEQSPGPSNSAPEDAPTSSHSPPKEPGTTPYSRSPELRVSHKLAERKRRREMRDLFGELRDQLPADRGMKASKWEILSKAIDFIGHLKQTGQEMGREIDMLRHELEGYRQGIPPPPFGPGAPPPHVMYGHGPPVGVPFAPGPPGPAAPPPPHPQHVQQQQAPAPPPHAAPPPLSRPGSSQNVYPPGAAVPGHAPPNGSTNPPAENPS